MGTIISTPFVQTRENMPHGSMNIINTNSFISMADTVVQTDNINSSIDGYPSVIDSHILQ